MRQNTILSNAIKFTDEGSICVAVDRSSTMEVLISVKDTGRYLDQEILLASILKVCHKIW